MSRIWDALRKAERSRARRVAWEAAPDPLEPRKERRRTPRLALSVGVFVYGHNPGETPFHEFSTTTCVNADGGTLAIAAEVQVGQEILLVNCNTQKEHRCRVVRVVQLSDGKKTVALEIVPPETSFWGLVYDPRHGLWQSA